MREKCAVFGIISSTDVFDRIYYALHSMQHRGQESAGIATSNDKIRVHKEMGMVADVFKSAYLSGKNGIGHVRYSTSGESKTDNAQPLLLNYAKGAFAIAHNGNIVNHGSLRSELEMQGSTFATTSDTEIIAKIIAHEHMGCESFSKAIANTMTRLKGSYSLAILYGDRVYAVRDPWGLRPLCIGKTEDAHMVASESCALDILGAELVRDVSPGEIVRMGSENGSVLTPQKRICHCMFEYVYFARPDSVLDGRSIYSVRRALGENLALEHPVEADMVAAVPDSGITHALGYAKQSGIPYGEALMKNRYVGRTFILPHQDQRDTGVRMKLNPLKSEIESKRIVLVDDSIVRGTTLKRIVTSLRQAGASEVHVRIACPPILNPCLYGIDMKTSREFIANNRSPKQISELIGADTLQYQSIEGLMNALNMKKNELCMACLDGDYPL